MTDRLRPWLMLAPALLVMFVLLFGGLISALVRSLGYMPVIGLTDVSLDAYAAILTSREFYLSLALSFHIAFTSTAISSVLAIAAALLLRRSFLGKPVITFLFQLNLTVPHLVGAIGVLALFSQSGSFARIAYHSGLITQPGDFPALIFDPYAIGIIVQYVWKEVPFIGLILLANLSRLDRDFESVARNLGASRWQSFRHVLLPQLLPALIPASVIVFAFTFGAYEIPLLLGQNHPAALPVLAWRSYSNADLAARPAAMAMAVIIAVISALLLWAYMRASRRGTLQ